MPSSNLDKAVSNESRSSAAQKLHTQENVEIGNSCSDRPVVVGLYGVSGSGKSFLLNQLKEELGQGRFKFYEGSKVINDVCPQGLDTFEEMEEQHKNYWRQLAIDTIKKECIENGHVAVVAGHLMLWTEGKDNGQPVYTPNDLNTLTHILYLAFPAEIISARRLNDSNKARHSVSITHLQNWQRAEVTLLRSLCRDNGILFSLISSHLTALSRISTLLCDFRIHSEAYNSARAKNCLDESVALCKKHMETALVIDGDKTLIEQDTGELFWQMNSQLGQSANDERPLKGLFSSPLGYSYTAFRQAALWYEEEANNPDFDALCEIVASMVRLRPELENLLRLTSTQDHIYAVVVSCGLRSIWEKIIEKHGLSSSVKVVSGGRIADGFVVNATVKAVLVSHLRENYGAFVWAFGDSPLDLDMLKKASKAIVVVGEEQTRSKSMDEALMRAIDNDGLLACQAVLAGSTQRLDSTRLPLARITEPQFLMSVLCRRDARHRLHFIHATTRSATQLLMTPMRNANVSGPALREAHRSVGWYLAIEYLSDLIGLEEFPIQHVQGQTCSGFRLLREKQTSIVALMRGGEPMALGINDAFPNALFLHASRPNDLKAYHLQERRAIILVDSVINSGNTIMEFVRHIQELHASIRIIVVAGVVQLESISAGGPIATLRQPNISLVALRVSGNKFTGKGGTDTGNRLYNTTHLL